MLSWWVELLPLCVVRLMAGNCTSKVVHGRVFAIARPGVLIEQQQLVKPAGSTRLVLA